MLFWILPGICTLKDETSVLPHQLLSWEYPLLREPGPYHVKGGNNNNVTFHNLTTPLGTVWYIHRGSGSGSGFNGSGSKTLKWTSVEFSFIRGSVADPNPGSGAFLTHGSGIRDGVHPGSYFRELRNNFWGLKYLNSLMRIRNTFDPGSGMEKFWSGINIPAPEHWSCENLYF